MRNLESYAKERFVEYENMPFIEIVKNMTDWLKINQLNYETNV